jgi:Leucine-rich repeat (LRR) protein
VLSRLSVLLAATVMAASATDDRAVAEWVIRQGGRVIIAGQSPISDLSALPATGAVALSGVDLYGTIIDPKDLSKLSDLIGLKELYLPGPSWNPGAGSKLDANEELKFLASLRSLEKLHFSLHFLTNVNVQDKGLKHLETLTNLKELRLAQGRVKNFSFAPFTQLEGLDLSYSTATDEVLKSLAGLKNLRRLNLRDTLVTDDGLAHLAGITTLEEIDLYGLKISDRGIAHLKNLRELKKLNLLGGPISDSGAEILAGLTKLRDLNLYRAELTNAGVSKLAGLRDLAFLDLRYTRATASGVDKLRTALPKCKIDFSGSSSLGAKTATVQTPAAGAPEAAIARWIREGLHGRVDLQNGRIRSVNLARSTVTDSQLTPIAGLPALEELDLDATEIGDLGLATLARSTMLKKLKLGSTTVSDRGLVHLAALKQLQSLSLSGALVRNLAPLPATLVELDLSSTGIGADAVPHIVALKNLRRLNLAYSDLNEASLLKLGEFAQAGSLRSLNLTGTDIGNTGLAEIAKLTQLEELMINHGRFTEKGIDILAPLVNLKRLEAVRTRVNGTAGATLATFNKLEQLNLDYTTFNDEGLKAITALPLSELRLDSANITDASVDALSSMKGLKLLNLYHTLVSEDAHTRLVKALPQTQIIWDRDSKLPNRRGS